MNIEEAHIITYAPKSGKPDESVYGFPTEARINQNCEDWKVPSDHSSGHLFEDWLKKRAPGVSIDGLMADRLREAWDASITHHTATLRRIGWIDQKGRVWTEVPSSASFDGGSLTPLLVDARE